MASSHPPSLLSLATRTIREAALFGRGDRVLVAVSGGPDSMALLHALARLRSKLGHAVAAHGVDHGLRAEAAGELDLVGEFARTLDVPFTRTTVAVAHGGNLQERARLARYEALRAAAGGVGAVVIATAHHRDDRAETVLLRLLRGAGPRGLAVLPPRAGDLVRPFLRASRAAIDAHVARHRVPFATDPSNRDPRFLRVRVRHELLPLLRELSPGIDEHLCALADQLGEAAVREAGIAGDPREPSDTPPDASPTSPASTSRLPRASRNALESLAESRSARARVALKDGLVGRWDAVSGKVTVERAPPRRRK